MPPKRRAAETDAAAAPAAQQQQQTKIPSLGPEGSASEETFLFWMAALQADDEALVAASAPSYGANPPAAAEAASQAAVIASADATKKPMQAAAAAAEPLPQQQQQQQMTLEAAVAELEPAATPTSPPTGLGTILQQVNDAATDQANGANAPAQQEEEFPRTQPPKTENEEEEGQVAVNAPAVDNPSSGDELEEEVVPESALADLVPLYASVLSGAMGPVVVDVRLQGSISLVCDPAAFAAVLDAHDGASSGPVRTLLCNTAPMLLLPETRPGKIFTVDAACCPVVPLLSQLLAEPRVTKVLLHARLLYRLLFLFLGTDRVDIRSVVDVTVWSHTLQQGITGATRITAAAEDAETAEGLRAALPDTTRALLQSRQLTVARQVAAYAAHRQQLKGLSRIGRQQQERESSARLGEDVMGALDFAARALGGGGAGRRVAEEGVVSAENEESLAADADDTRTANDVMRGVAPLHPMVSLPDGSLSGDGRTKKKKKGDHSDAGQPLPADHAAYVAADDTVGVESRQRRRRARDDTGTSGCGSDAEVLGSVFGGLSAVYHYYDTLLRPLAGEVVVPRFHSAETSAHQDENQAGESTGAVLTVDAERSVTAADVCVRRTYANFLCATMGFHGVHVSRAAYTDIASDLIGQVAELVESGATALRALRESVRVEATVDGTVAPNSQEIQVSNDMRRLFGAASAADVAALSATAATTTTTASGATQVLHFIREVCGQSGACTASLRSGLQEAQRRFAGAHPNLDPEAPGSATKLLTLAAATFRQAVARQCETALAPPTTPDSESLTSAALNNGTSRSTNTNSIALAAVATLVEAWLAVQERQRSLKALTDPLAKLSVHVVSPPPPPPPAASCGGAEPPTPTLAYSLYPTWSMHDTTTGRIFCSAPNLQTLPKEQPTAQYSCDTIRAQAQILAEQLTREHPLNNKTSAQALLDVLRNSDSGDSTAHPMWRRFPEYSPRHLYAAPPGCVFVSFDYNQIELRVLAHLSGDEMLLRQFRDGGDVLAAMARAVFRTPPEEAVTAVARQSVKVIVYGMLYGMGNTTLDLKLRELAEANASVEKGNEKAKGSPAAPPVSAYDLQEAFGSAYPAVRAYLRQTRQTAHLRKEVRTLSGLVDLRRTADANRRKQIAVSMAVQGGAADILHAAIAAVHRARHQLIPYFPVSPAALSLCVHDELVYAMPAAAVPYVTPRVRAIMEAQDTALGLALPLKVKVRAGPSLGQLADMDAV